MGIKQTQNSNLSGLVTELKLKAVFYKSSFFIIDLLQRGLRVGLCGAETNTRLLSGVCSVGRPPGAKVQLDR